MNLSDNFFEHRKTRSLVLILGRDAEALPLRLWAFVSRCHSAEGRLSGYTVQQIEETAGWRGKAGQFVAAMEHVGWLVPLPDGQAGWQCHQWQEHQAPRLTLAEAETRCDQVLASALEGWQAALAEASEQARQDRALDAQLDEACQALERERYVKAGKARAAKAAATLPATLPANATDLSNKSGTSSTATSIRPSLDRIFDAKPAGEAEPREAIGVSSNEGSKENGLRSIVPSVKGTFGTGLPQETQVKSRCSREREAHLMGVMRQVLGKEEMNRKGGYWRLEIRKDYELITAVLADVIQMKKDGEQRDNWGAYFQTVYGDWREKRALAPKKGKP